VRFDNLGQSPWANLKVGKFELDNLLSEKRFTWLSNNGGFLYAYHYLPSGSANNFGFGDNQIGAEVSGHSFNSYPRYSVALLTTDDGEPGLPGGKSMDAMFTLSQAFAPGGGLGPQRVGVFGYLGHRPTTFETVVGAPIPGTGAGNKSFYRIGATAQLWLGNLELLPLVSHAQDDAALGPGPEKPTWNNALLEAHYAATPRLMVQGRNEAMGGRRRGAARAPVRRRGGGRARSGAGVPHRRHGGTCRCGRAAVRALLRRLSRWRRRRPRRGRAMGRSQAARLHHGRLQVS